jgi:hypothetical protein
MTSSASLDKEEKKGTNEESRNAGKEFQSEAPNLSSISFLISCFPDSFLTQLETKN